MIVIGWKFKILQPGSAIGAPNCGTACGPRARWECFLNAKTHDVHQQAVMETAFDSELRVRGRRYGPSLGLLPRSSIFGDACSANSSVSPFFAARTRHTKGLRDAIKRTMRTKATGIVERRKPQLTAAS